MDYETVENINEDTTHVFERFGTAKGKRGTFSRTVCGVNLGVTPVRSGSITDVNCVNCLRILRSRIETQLDNQQ